MERIAIIGTGIAGMASAWLLHDTYDITVYEQNHYIGGHSNTVDVSFGDEVVPVDTGFIVFNFATYPNLVPLFEHLEVPIKKSDMTFGISANDGAMEYALATLNSLFAQRKRLADPQYYRMIRDILSFFKRGPGVLDTHMDLSIGEMIDHFGFGEYFRQYFLLPMGGAIWSCPTNTMLDYPAKTFIRFFMNHGLMSVNGQHQWYTVDGGSREYVKRITAPYLDRIRLNTPVMAVRRKENGVEVMDHRGQAEMYDQVVIAAHGDQALAMLDDPSAGEQRTLGAFRYQTNEAVLHSDPALMPDNQRAWASWVYLADTTRENEARVAVTYWMNRLQSIPDTYPLFVTLNPTKAIDDTLVHRRITYEHPIFDKAAITAQSTLSDIQGSGRIWYCGSYHRYGFHEDGLMAAVDVANQLGVKAPWQ